MTQRGSMVHYFHCTDGIDLIVDTRGKRTPSETPIEPMALGVATEVMAQVPDAGIDWSTWLVSVHDATGSLIATVPFPAGRA